MGGEDLQASKHRQPASTGSIAAAGGGAPGRQAQPGSHQAASAVPPCSAAIARAHSARGRPSPRPERCHAPNSTQT
jgi:hypothetical protein